MGNEGLRGIVASFWARFNVLAFFTPVMFFVYDQRGHRIETRVTGHDTQMEGNLTLGAVLLTRNS